MDKTKFIDESHGTIIVPMFQGGTMTFSIPALNLMAFVQKHWDEIVYISENSPDEIVKEAGETALKIISQKQATNETETASQNGEG